MTEPVNNVPSVQNYVDALAADRAAAKMVKEQEQMFVNEQSENDKMQGLQVETEQKKQQEFQIPKEKESIAQSILFFPYRLGATAIIGLTDAALIIAGGITGGGKGIHNAINNLPDNQFQKIWTREH